MDCKEKLSSGQTMALVYGSAAGNLVYTFTWITNITGRPFWVAVFTGVLTNIPFAVWILYLGKFMQGGTIFDILESGLGKIISKLIIIAYLLLNIILAVCLLNMFAETVKVFFLENTPVWVIMFIVVSMCSIFTNSGIKSFGYLIVILVVLYMINYFTGFTLTFFNLFRIKYIIPVFDSTLSQFIEGTLVTAGANTECLLFLMIMVSSIPEPQKHYAWVIKGLVIWAALLSFAIFIMSGVISPEMLSRVAQAGITVARVIQLGKFIQGLEILILMTYQYITTVKIVIYLYSCWVSTKKLLGVKKGRLLLISAAVMIFIPSVWVNSYNMGYFLSIFLGTYILLPFVTFVLLLGSVSAFIIRKRNGRIAK